MTNRRIFFIIGVLLLLVVAVFVVNFYFLARLSEDDLNKVSSVRVLENVIRSRVRHLKPVYLNRNPRFFMYRNKLLRNFKPAPYENASIIWDIVNWVGGAPNFAQSLKL